MDLFEEWIMKKDSIWIERALTDSSYVNYIQRGITKKDSLYSEVTKSIPINTDLATLGDAIIKFVYSEYLLDNSNKLTIEKSRLESDERFVKVIAKHYNLLKYIKKDIDDDKMPSDYCYLESEKKNKKNNPYKYIATCVEAIVAAIYKETNDLDAIRKLVISWKDF